MLLAIDTATATVGAAVHDGERVRGEVVHQDVRRHGELLAPAVRRALEKAGATPADLTSVVCGVGPGPFTGLRVGVVTALVLAHTLDLPRPRGICSLDALAHQTLRHLERQRKGRQPKEGELLVATDARRKEVYWARYVLTAAGARRVAGPGVARAADLPEEVRGLPAVGRGTVLYPEALPHTVEGGPLDVSPAALAELAHRMAIGAHPDAGTGLLDPEPLYLRRPDALAAEAR